jgi:hypothetical protein
MKLKSIPVILILFCSLGHYSNARTRIKNQHRETLSDVKYVNTGGTPGKPIVIKGKRIVSTSESGAALDLRNCHDFVIYDNVIDASTTALNDKAQLLRFSIHLYNCSNITIRHNRILNGSTNILAEQCTNNIVIDSNDMINAHGPYPTGMHVQFNRTSGSGNMITNNRMENFQGKSYPEDAISLYKSNGTSNSHILVKGNWIRGGGPSTTGAGITVGDNGGSYQTITENRIVNSGHVGIQTAGGHNIIVTKNVIYGAYSPWSGLGLGSGNWSDAPSYDNEIHDNTVNWIEHTGYRRDTGWRPNNKNQRPSGWTNNTPKAAITPESVLPKKILKDTTQ